MLTLNKKQKYVAYNWKYFHPKRGFLDVFSHWSHSPLEQFLHPAGEYFVLKKNPSQASLVFEIG